jgi:competence ComEA-like helix-hairpin-helix protein
MRFLSKLNQFFGFTPTESKVVFFLVITFVAGGTVKLYRVYFPPDPSKRFDYSEADREFAQRSMMIDSIEASTSDAEPYALDSLKQTGRARRLSRNTPVTKGLPAGTILNLNTASKAELVKLPGIGEATAERILLYREENGRFRKTDELKNVKGIGEKKFQKIKPLVKAE